VNLSKTLTFGTLTVDRSIGTRPRERNRLSLWSGCHHLAFPLCDAARRVDCPLGAQAPVSLFAYFHLSLGHSALERFLTSTKLRSGQVIFEHAAPLRTAWRELREASPEKPDGSLRSLVSSKSSLASEKIVCPYVTQTSEGGEQTPRRFTVYERQSRRGSVMVSRRVLGSSLETACSIEQ
jgi:hypothetical protein